MMLGIRRFHQSIAIDVWCGEAKDFVADRMSPSLQEAWPDYAKHSDRHLALLSPDHDLESWMQELRTACLQIIGQKRRITLICRDLDHYEKVQHVMMQTFEEEPCG